MSRKLQQLISTIWTNSDVVKSCRGESVIMQSSPGSLRSALVRRGGSGEGIAVLQDIDVINLA